MTTDHLDAENVGAGFDNAADTYADLLAHNRTGAQRLVDALPDGGYDTLLDVGCGTGFASLAVVERFGTTRVLGIDASEGMMDVFRRNADGIPGLTLDLQVADAAALPAPDGAFDAVISTMAFHWFPDKAKALSEMARCVRPGGIVAILTAGRGTDAEFKAVMEGITPPVPPQWIGVFDRIHRDVPEMHAMLGEAGLEPVDVWSETRWRTVPPMAYLDRMNAVASHLSSDLSSEEAQAHGERLAAALIAASGPEGFGYSFVKLFAIARRPQA